MKKHLLTAAPLILSAASIYGSSATDMGSEVPLNSVEATTVGVYARTFQRNLSNFALAGPYATLMLGF